MSGNNCQIHTRLNSVFQEVFDDESIEIFDQMTAKDVGGWDSLMHITLVLAIEKRFAFRFTAEELGQLKSVGEILEVVQQRGK